MKNQHMGIQEQLEREYRQLRPGIPGNARIRKCADHTRAAPCKTGTDLDRFRMLPELNDRLLLLISRKPSASIFSSPSMLGLARTA